MVQLITNKKKKRGNTRVLRKELPMNIHLKKKKNRIKKKNNLLKTVIFLLLYSFPERRNTKAIKNMKNI